MSSISNEHLEALRSSIEHTVPICQGTLPVPTDALTLFYAKGPVADRVELSHAATPADVEELWLSCHPATFGAHPKDSSDTPHGKPGKLEASDFSVKLGDAVSDILKNAVRPVLAQDDTREVKAELHQLTVYGEGSFFEPHRVTPRSTDVFGVLILVFPVAHSGGASVLKHRGLEWVFDAAKLLAADAASDHAASEAAASRVAFVAFSCDVEHELLPVESGDRVTVTYNLYFEAGVSMGAPQTTASYSSPTERAFEDALKAMLADATFLADGGHLVFGLRHYYPASEEVPLYEHTLKGTDALIQHVCARLGLASKLKLFYESYFYDSRDRFRKELYMLDDAVQVSDKPTTTDVEFFDGQGIAVRSEDEDRVRARAWLFKRRRGADMVWVNEGAGKSQVRTAYIDDGNRLSHMHGEYKLVAAIGPCGRRTSEVPPPRRLRSGAKESDSE